MNLKYWLLAFRPKTLTAAVVPIVSATALVVAMGVRLEAWIPVLALLISLLIQIGTNLINDSLDFTRGADTENRLGPTRVTQSGVFSPKLVLKVGIGFLAVAILAGIPLVFEGGLPILIIGLLSVACAYLYTGGPFPLAYTGLGDLFVILFFGIVAVMGLVFLLTKAWIFEALILGVQIGLLCATLIAINNLRDVEGDKLVNKKTLPVRFGKVFARFEIAAFCALPFVLQLFWMQKGVWFASFLPLILIPRAIGLVRLVFQTEPSSAYNQFLERAAQLHLAFGLLISVGLIL